MSNSKRAWFLWPLVVLLLPLVVIVAMVWFVAAISLLVVVWTTWCPRGRYALVVYSSSPIWQQYFEERMLPRSRASRSRAELVRAEAVEALAVGGVVQDVRRHP